MNDSRDLIIARNIVAIRSASYVDIILISLALSLSTLIGGCTLWNKVYTSINSVFVGTTLYKVK